MSWVHSIFSFFGHFDQNQKNHLSFSGKVRIFYTENKQIGQLIFFVFGHFDQKTKNEKWNEPDTSVREKLLKFKAEGREFAKFLRFFLTVGQKNFGNKIPFL